MQTVDLDLESEAPLTASLKENTLRLSRHVTLRHQSVKARSSIIITVVPAGANSIPFSADAARIFARHLPHDAAHNDIIVLRACNQ